MSDIIALYKDAAGLWWFGRYRTIIEAVANLILNFLFGWLWGINGILIATILTMLFVGHGYGGYIIFKHYFANKSFSKYIVRQFLYFVVGVAACTLSYFVCTFIPELGILEIIIKLGICLLIPNIVLLGVYFRSKRFKASFSFIKNVMFAKKAQ